MTKAKLKESKDTPPQTAKSKTLSWSREKSAALRLAAKRRAAGDCNCNCACGK